MTSQPPNPTFDARLVRHRMARALAAPDFPDFLHIRTADDMAARLDLITRDFNTTLIIADKPDDVVARLATSDRLGSIQHASTAASGNSPVISTEAFPFRAGSLDCIISVLNLHHVNDLPGALVQMRQALKPDGLFMASLLGGTTLAELRHAWLIADSELSGGASPRVAPFADIRDMGGLLQRAGFALPVVDTDVVTATYQNPLALMREIKAMGLSNALTGRSRTPVRRETLALACATYAAEFSNSESRVPATFEIINLIGWSPHESQQQPLKPGSARMRLADALSTKEHKA